mgnify:CR=1 FL=1
MARSTWDGSSEPEVHAEPLEPHIPFWSRRIRLRSMSPLYEDFKRRNPDV